MGNKLETQGATREAVYAPQHEVLFRQSRAYALLPSRNRRRAVTDPPAESHPETGAGAKPVSQVDAPKSRGRSESLLSVCAETDRAGRMKARIHTRVA